MEFLTRRDTLVSLPHVLNSERVNSSSKLWISSTSMTQQVHMWINHMLMALKANYKTSIVYRISRQWFGSFNCHECITFFTCESVIVASFFWYMGSFKWNVAKTRIGIRMYNVTISVHYMKCDCKCSVAGYFLCLSCQKYGSWQMLQENIAALTFTNIKNPSRL
mgnify:CR=1 FL=1